MAAKPKPRTKVLTAAERIALLRPPTAAERAAIAAANEREAQRPARVRVTSETTEEGKSSMWPAHSDGEGFGGHFRDTFGTASNTFASESISRLDPILRDRGAGQAPAPDRRVNSALAVMGAIAPQNELEAIIGEQIIAAHALSMDLLSKATHADTIPKMEAYANMATKVSRTQFAAIETLSRLRSGGKQQVIVKHVYVNGNAVVADHAETVIQRDGSGGVLRNIDQSRAAGLLDAPGDEVWREDQGWVALPVSGGPGSEALSDARRNQQRRADGKGERPVSDGQAHPGGDARQGNGQRLRQARKGRDR